MHMYIYAGILVPQCLNFAAASFCFLWCLTFIYDDSDAESGDGGTCPAGHEARPWPNCYYPYPSPSPYPYP